MLFITHGIEEAIFLSDRVYVMTARPGRIKAEIDIPLPRPRPRMAEMMSSPQFTQILHKLRNLIREESLTAMGTELDAGGLDGFATEVGSSGVLQITGSDAITSHLPHGWLRTHCRCAGCQQQARRSEATPPLADNLRLSDIRPVADKGLNLVFSDGHDRGIYPWPHLRELGELAAAAATARADTPV